MVYGQPETTAVGSSLNWYALYTKSRHEKHIHSLDRQEPLHPGDGENERETDDGAQRQRHPPPPRADLDVGFPCQPENPGQRGKREQQIKWMGELHLACCVLRVA